MDHQLAVSARRLLGPIVLVDQTAQGRRQAQSRGRANLVDKNPRDYGRNILKDVRHRSGEGGNKESHFGNNGVPAYPP